MSGKRLAGILCPSTDLSESTHVLGVRGEDGLVTMLPAPLPLPDVALEELSRENIRESVRLVGTCIQKECLYWSNHCQLGREISVLANNSNLEIFTCPISNKCRWRLENGNSVCRICTHIMREKSIAELEENVNGNR
jgi:hypothetical protein